MIKKRSFLFILALILILPSFLVNGSPNVSSSSANNEPVQKDGKAASKDEVVYATLSATGKMEEIYVVNILDVIKAGTVTDFGAYSHIKNLTNLSEIDQIDDTIRITASEGRFYYQGNTNEQHLPWDIAVSYLLNGKPMQPEDLLGLDGHLQLNITTSANENVDRTFYDNYLLQISLVLDSDIFSKIQATDASIANVGKNQQYTFTVLPEQDGNFTIEADVIDFEMRSIEIDAIPFSMSIDFPDIDDMTDDIQSLTDAIKMINDGVFELKNGVSELNSGVRSLRKGSAEYKNGIKEINQGSSELVEASATINTALKTVSDISNSDLTEIDLGDLNLLPEDLSELSARLNEVSGEIALLRENYSSAYGALDEVIRTIPDYTITENEIEELYNSGADSNTIDKLVETYSAAASTRRTYEDVSESFKAFDTPLKKMLDYSDELSNFIVNELHPLLETMDVVASFTKVSDGMSVFANGYEEFHEGLVSYTEGVAMLTSSYNEIHSGIVQLSDGTEELEDGVGELHKGTDQLNHSTSDLPDHLKEEIDLLMADYDSSDFDPVSFISGKTITS
ncbi:MAG: YhgE/Pip domain-containing protein [Bacillaceae bacterium]|nr:YhgE/Pip domain-containing protein [Bacillaceae bacterium]